MEMAHLSPLSFCESSKKSVSLVSLPRSFHSSLFSSQLSFCPPNLPVVDDLEGTFPGTPGAAAASAQLVWLGSLAWALLTTAALKTEGVGPWM